DFHVTGVQTCALPISVYVSGAAVPLKQAARDKTNRYGKTNLKRFTLLHASSLPSNITQFSIHGYRDLVLYLFLHQIDSLPSHRRSEERRVGKVCRTWY